MTVFANLELARRLEAAEGNACVQFATARERLFPGSGSESIRYAGVYAAFDGVDSPVTQTFGLGVLGEVNDHVLETIEKFFFDRGAPVFHEVSPFAGVSALNLLCSRNYSPLELSNVLYRVIAPEPASSLGEIRVRIPEAHEMHLWAKVSAEGWAHEYPDLLDFLLQAGTISSGREDTICFLAEYQGVPGAAGALCIHEGVALFGGAATVPYLRRRGLQTALLGERMRYASERGCDLAMMVAQPGSNSQRNSERAGFRVAYTRTKWQLKGN